MLNNAKKIKDGLCPICDVKLLQREYSTNLRCDRCNLTFYKGLGIVEWNYFSSVYLDQKLYRIYWMPEINLIKVYVSYAEIFSFPFEGTNIMPSNIKEKLPTLLNFM